MEYFAEFSNPLSARHSNPAPGIAFRLLVLAHVVEAVAQVGVIVVHHVAEKTVERIEAAFGGKVG